MLSSPIQIISDIELLTCLNRLRRVEDRQPLIYLPLQFAFADKDTRLNLYNRWDSEYRIHRRDKERFRDYHYQIILNKTEYKLYIHNKARAASHKPQIHSLQFKYIDPQDLRYYFPTKYPSRTATVFITDSDSKYVTSVIQVTSGSTTLIRGSHNFHISYSYNEQTNLTTPFAPPRSSSPQFSQPATSPVLYKPQTLPRVYPDLSDILDIEPKLYPDLLELYKMTPPSQDPSTGRYQLRSDSCSPAERPTRASKSKLLEMFKQHNSADETQSFTPKAPNRSPTHYGAVGGTKPPEPEDDGDPPSSKRTAGTARRRLITVGDYRNPTNYSDESDGSTKSRKSDNSEKSFKNPNIKQDTDKVLEGFKNLNITPEKDPISKHFENFNIALQKDREKRLLETNISPIKPPILNLNKPPDPNLQKFNINNTGAIPKNHFQFSKQNDPNILPKNNGQNDPTVSNSPTDKDLLLEAQNAAKTLIRQNTDLRNEMLTLRLQFDSLILQNARSITPPPKSPKLISLNNSDNPFSVGGTPPRTPPPIANPEYSAVQTQITQLTNIINNLQVKLETTEQNLSKTMLSDVEKTVLSRLASKAAPDASTLIYALAKPTNILREDEDREPKYLSILKGHAALATLGTFDPDKNTKADFRDTWDRILNYTKNHKLYEYEYVDLLMAVMKGSAASTLSGMIREYDGDLTKIIEAIQDIYIPQHTIYDDVEELNKFKRMPKENIRSMMRRASLVINKLRNTCTEAAWPDRRYHLLLSLLKQMIDKKTFKHLHAKELEAAHIGQQIKMSEIIDIVALHEHTEESVPEHETRLNYNINTLQLTNHPDKQRSDIEELKLRVNALFPKRARTDNSSSSSSFRSKTPTTLERYRQNRMSTRKSFQPSQRRPDGTRDYKSQSSTYSSRSSLLPSSSSSSNFSNLNRWVNNSSNTNPFSLRSRSQSRNFDRSRSRKRSYSSGPNTYQSIPNYRQRSNSRSQSRSRYNSRDRGRSTSRSSYRSYGSRPRSTSSNRSYYNSPHRNAYNSPHRKADYNRKFQKSFQKGNNSVSLTFYECKLCFKTHLEGTPCTKKTN